MDHPSRESPLEGLVAGTCSDVDTEAGRNRCEYHKLPRSRGIDLAIMDGQHISRQNIF